MQVETKKPCSACAAQNAHDATYCWRCFARFAPAMPEAPAAGGRMPPAPAPAWGPSGGPLDPTPTPHKGNLLRTVLVTAVGLTLVGGGLSLLRSGPSLPDEVAGRARVSSAEVSRFEEQMRGQAGDWDLDIEVGVYGTAAKPDVFVILVDGGAVETTDELFDEFVSGMETAGAKVRSEDTVRGERDGTEYRCVPVSDGIAAAACFWRESDNVGIVLGLDRTAEEGVDLLFATHDAVMN
jgi:hypothetical protein